MSGESTTKVRVVRCPKCRLLLPELPGFDVYKCGECGTTLKAKRRESDSVKSKVSASAAVAAQTSGLDAVLKDDGSDNSTQTATSSSLARSSHENFGDDQNKSSKINSKQIGGVMSSDEKQSRSDEKNFSGCITEEIHHSTKVYSSELSLGENEGSSTLAAGSDASCCSLSAGEEEGLPSAGEDVVLEKSQSASNGSDSTPGSSSRENPVNVARNHSFNFAGRPEGNSISSSPSEQVQQGQKSNMDRSVTNVVNQGLECSQANDGSLFSYDEIEETTNENSVSRGQASKLQADHCENDSSVERISRESCLAANGSDSYAPACRPAEESVSSSTLVSSSQKQDEAQTSDINSFGRLKSPDTVETKENGITDSELSETPREMTNSSTIRGSRDDGGRMSSMKETLPSSSLLSSSEKSHEVRQGRMSKDEIETRESVNLISKLSATCRDMHKFPTARSLHAYDGSFSSYDEIEDQFFNPHLSSSDSIYYDTRVSVSEGWPRRNDTPSKSHDGLGIQQESGESSSDLSRKKHYSVRPMKQDQAELLKTMNTMHDYPTNNRRRLERDEYYSRLSQFPRSSRAGFESGSLSDQFYNDYHYSSSNESPDMYENPDHEKMKLLKMVYELQEQLQRTPYFNGRTNGVAPAPNLSTEIHPSWYNSHDADERIFRYGSNWRYDHRLSRIPFSVEASTSRQPMEHPCIYCDAQDWRFSEDIPPTIPRQKNGFSRYQLDLNYCKSHNPFPSSPHRFADSEFPRWASEAQPDDQGDRVQKFLEEKQTRVKRPFRPIAGGAPFITCYNCLELLQLPEDFILFRRRYHRITCGSCTKVLKFSLQDRTHIVSYAPAEVDPPPSMVDSFAMAAPRGDPISTFHANRSASADNASFSDDYGKSLRRSNSSQDPRSPSTLQRFSGDVYDRTGSYGSNMPDRRREEGLLRRTLNRYKTLADTDESARPSSSKTKPDSSSPDTEDRSPAKNSPLHRLMGYYSPSQVMRGTAASVPGVHVGHGKS